MDAVGRGEHTDGPPAYYAAALDAEEFDAYLQALGLESLRDEAALIRAKVRAHLGGTGDERRELPLLLRAIEVLVRVVQADRAASRDASAQAQDLAHVVESVLADLDSGGPASDCPPTSGYPMADTATAVGPGGGASAVAPTSCRDVLGTAVPVPATRPQSEAARPTEAGPPLCAGERP